jgi:hypothetical protein
MAPSGVGPHAVCCRPSGEHTPGGLCPEQCSQQSLRADDAPHTGERSGRLITLRVFHQLKQSSRHLIREVQLLFLLEKSQQLLVQAFQAIRVFHKERGKLAWGSQRFSQFERRNQSVGERNWLWLLFSG